jgi:AcrR family transcriptional regulator
MEKHEKIRQKLIESAEQIFSRFGFEKATMNDIADEARKGKSSLYYYFSSKEEIFKAVVETEAQRLKSCIAEAIEGVDDIKEKIRIYFTIRMNRFQELVNLYAAMRNDYLRKLDFIEKIRRNYDQEELEFIQELLTEGIENQVFSIKNVADTSYALASAIKGLEYPLVLRNDDKQSSERIDALLNVLFFGIVKR